MRIIDLLKNKNKPHVTKFKSRLYLQYSRNQHEGLMRRRFGGNYAEAYI